MYVFIWDIWIIGSYCNAGLGLGGLSSGIPASEGVSLMLDSGHVGRVCVKKLKIWIITARIMEYYR